MADDDFDKAFAEFAGDKPADDEPPADAGDPPDDDPEAPASAEGDSDGGTDGSPGEPATPPDDAARLREENEKLRHQVESDRGRVSALTRKNLALSQALKQASAAAKSLGTDFAVPGDDDEESREFDESYSDISKQINRRAARAATTAVAKVFEPLESAVASADQDAANEAHSAVLEAIPDTPVILGQPEFHTWLGKQPRHVQAIFAEGEPDESIWLLNQWKSSPDYVAPPAPDGSEPPSAEPPKSGNGAGQSGGRSRADRHIDPGTTAEGSAAGGDVDEFEAAFNSFAAAAERRMKASAR